MLFLAFVPRSSAGTILKKLGKYKARNLSPKNAKKRVSFIKKL